MALFVISFSFSMFGSDQVAMIYKLIILQGAAIEEAGKRGSHLTLSRANPGKYGDNNYPWVDMGDYGGKKIH